MEKTVKLQIKHGHCHWTVYTRGEWEYDETIEEEYKLGDQLKMFGFYDYRITEITDDHIVIESNDDKRILTHDKPVGIVTEIEEPVIAANAQQGIRACEFYVCST